MYSLKYGEGSFDLLLNSQGTLRSLDNPILLVGGLCGALRVQEIDR